MHVLLVALLSTGCVTAHKRDQSSTRTDLGTAYLREKNPSSAIRVLEEATHLDPRNTEAWDALGLAYLAGGAPDKAEHAFKRAVRLGPEQAQPNNNYGLLLLDQGRLDEAIERFEAATGDLTYRKPAMVLNNLGYALHQAGRDQDALLRLDDAVRRAPNLCQARFNRGLVYQSLEQPAPALDDFEAVVALCEDQATGAYYHGAQSMLALGDQPGACTWLRLAIGQAGQGPLGMAVRDLYVKECE